jgi:hypothetical protein
MFKKAPIVEYPRLVFFGETGELQRMHRYLVQSPFSWLLGQDRVTLVRMVAIAGRHMQAEAHSIRRRAWLLRIVAVWRGEASACRRHLRWYFDGRCGARGSLLVDV